jgi:hypothetical protein
MRKVPEAYNQWEGEEGLLGVVVAVDVGFEFLEHREGYYQEGDPEEGGGASEEEVNINIKPSGVRRLACLIMSLLR